MNLILIAHAAGESMTELTNGVNSIYKYSIGIGGILAFGIILFAGIEYIVSAGNAGRQADAKDRIFMAVLGLVLLLGAAFILQAFPGLLTSGFQNPADKNAKLLPVSEITDQRRAEIVAAIREMIKTSDGTITSYKTIFAKIREEFKKPGNYTVEFNVAVGEFFNSINQNNKDLEFYNSLETLSEKADNIRLHFFGKVDSWQIARSMQIKDIPAIYDAINAYEDQAYLLRHIGADSKIYDLWKITETQAFPTTKLRLLGQLDNPGIIKLFNLSTYREQVVILDLLKALNPRNKAFYAELQSKFGKKQ